MKRRGKITLLSILFLLSIIGLIILFCNKLISYAIICGTVSVVLLVALIVYVIATRSDESIYKSELKKILKTYDAILVKSSGLLDLDDRNIIVVDSIQDLVNAQVEIRKPIFYKMQASCCCFFLLDDKEACCFVLKANDEVVSDLDLLIKERSLIKKRKKDDDYSLLKNIDKTAIIMLENSKSFKVSPIRKKKEVNDDIEIL